jgi:hypothetical protein
VELHDRHRAPRRERIDVELAGDRGHRRDQRRVGGQPVRHHPAVGHSRGVDPAAVNREAVAHEGDDRVGEADVIDAVPGRGRAAAAGVEGQQPALPSQESGPVGVHDDKPVPVGSRVHARVTPLLRGVAAAAVVVDHQRQRSRRVRRDMDQEPPGPATERQRYLPVAGPGPGHGQIHFTVAASVRPWPPAALMVNLPPEPVTSAAGRRSGWGMAISSGRREVAGASIE